MVLYFDPDSIDSNRRGLSRLDQSIWAGEFGGGFEVFSELEGKGEERRE